MNRISLIGERCKGCGICIALCPKETFDALPDGRPRQERAGDCVGCRLCVLRCPDFALELEGSQ